MEKFIKRWLWRILSLFIGIILAYQVWILGHVVFWNFYDPSTSAFMQARLDLIRQINPAAVLRTQGMPYEQTSPNPKHAMHPPVDGKFPQHAGIA